MKVKLIREVTKEECGWLSKDFPEATELFVCTKATYGCISPSGIALTEDPEGDYPFFEIPRNAIGIEFGQDDNKTRIYPG